MPGFKVLITDCKASLLTPVQILVPSFSTILFHSHLVPSKGKVHLHSSSGIHSLFFTSLIVACDNFSFLSGPLSFSPLTTEKHFHKTCQCVLMEFLYLIHTFYSIKQCIAIHVNYSNIAIHSSIHTII